MTNELLILVDEKDNEIGLMDKLTVHQKGLLHRAFSVFIYDSNDQLLLQQRSDKKYHSNGLWSNTCCSHPNNFEEMEETIKRRLKEEMGIETSLQFQFSFIYQTTFENGLTEHEYDHVYFGRSDDKPLPDLDEVKAWRYVTLKKLNEEILLNAQNFSVWLKICLPEVEKHFKQKFQLP